MAGWNDLFDAIISEKRREILQILKNREFPVPLIAQKTGLGKETTYYHLKILKHAGFIKERLKKRNSVLDTKIDWQGNPKAKKWKKEIKLYKITPEGEKALRYF